MKRLLALLMAALLILSFGLSALAEGLDEVPSVDDLEFADDDLESTGDDLPQTEGDGADLGADDQADEEPVDMGDFVVGATTELNGMFFTNMWGNNTCDIDIRALIHGYSPVAWTKQEVFQPNPYVVQDLTTGVSSEGNKIYMVALMDDLYYSDGSKITAADYVFSLMLHAAPQITAIDGMTTNVGYIMGYEAYNSGESEIFAGLHIYDELTFSVEIKAEYLPFFFELSMIDSTPYPIAVIAPGCEVADDGDGAYIRNIDQQITEPIFTPELLTETILDPDTGYRSHPSVTSGPYMLTDFDWETREARFNINPYYKCDFEGYVPTIDNIVFKAVTPENMIEQIETGELQLLNKVVAGDNIMAGLQLGGDVAAPVNYPRMGLGFIAFACEEGPGSYLSVRQALNYVLDTEQFVQDYNQSFGIQVYGYYGVGQWMYRYLAGMRDEMTYETDEEMLEAETAWNALTLDGLEKYVKDVDYARSLLVDDGWVLNELGETFVEGVDDVRYKYVDGDLMGLTLQFGKMKDSTAVELLLELLIEPASEIGIKIEVTEVEFTTLLQHYYRQVDRTYDMMYLATNFIAIFDPYFVFNTHEEYQGHQNTTGYIDEQLEQLALDMRRTQPGALLEYAQKWLKFQEYYSEVIPMIPIYTNIYFDFHTPLLTNYDPDALWGWTIAIVRAQYGYPVVEDVDAGLEGEGFDNIDNIDDLDSGSDDSLEMLD